MPDARPIVPTGHEDFTIGAESQRLHVVSMGERRTNRFAGDGVPKADETVPTRRGQELPVGVKGHGFNRASVPKRITDGLSFRHLPEPDYPFTASGCQRFAVRTEFQFARKML